MVASCALVLSAIFGIGAARLMSRARFRGQALVDAILLLPLVLPPVVTGYVLLILLGREGFIGAFLWEKFGVRLIFTPFAAVLASTAVAFPLVYGSAKAAFGSLDGSWSDVAQVLGASPARAFWTISVPLCAPALAAGLVLAFARALGEFGATILVAGNVAGQTETMPLAIYGAIQDADFGLAGRYCLLLALFNLAALWFCNFLGARHRSH